MRRLLAILVALVPIGPKALSFAAEEEPPRIIAKSEPRYTGVEGSVRMQVKVDAKGHVSSIRIVEPLGQDQDLNKAAIECVQRWRFRAATRDGVSVEGTLPVEVKFVRSHSSGSETQR